MRQRGTIIKHFTRKKTRLHTLFFDYMFDKKKRKRAHIPNSKSRLQALSKKLQVIFQTTAKGRLCRKPFIPLVFQRNMLLL